VGWYPIAGWADEAQGTVTDHSTLVQGAKGISNGSMVFVTQSWGADYADRKAYDYGDGPKKAPDL